MITKLSLQEVSCINSSIIKKRNSQIDIVKSMISSTVNAVRSILVTYGPLTIDLLSLHQRERSSFARILENSNLFFETHQWE
jgi:signal transduction histidine kinase